MTTQTPNPVKRETALRAYPGWKVREYADGMFDATDGKGLTTGEATFQDAVAAIRTCMGLPPRAIDTPGFRATAKPKAPGQGSFASGPLLTGVRASWQQLETGWCVKISANAHAGSHSGREVQVEARSGKVKTVRLGALVDQWNGGRAAVYKVGR